MPGNLPLGPRYPSRNSSNKPAVPQSQRLKPSINSRPEISNPYRIKPINNVRAVAHGHRNSKPITSGGQSGRPRPITSSISKSSNQENQISSLSRTTGQPVGVKMKPVHEEGSLMRMPVYINSFPEFSHQESSKLKDGKTVNYYEPLGDYARF
ncbi:uncharacterized protein LOC123317332 [Coccinella septempunctata]|uniref:uncharacterized protein LOC123317332 n=1 Tax=Coccinella septempunctata TaxID=41139 RepID=UPI001D06E9C5|nr:uncharacterized protein LOC123317332 [Coccinella septempunctata]